MEEQIVSRKAGAEIIRLTDQSGKVVMVSTADGDRFTVSARVAARACKSFEKFEEFSEQFDRLIGKLHRWTQDRGEEIDRAYFVVDHEGPVFVAVRKDKAFNPDFEDALSLLDLDICHDEAFNLIELRVMALPYCSDDTMASFVGLAAGPIIDLT